MAISACSFLVAAGQLCSGLLLCSRGILYDIDTAFSCIIQWPSVYQVSASLACRFFAAVNFVLTCRPCPWGASVRQWRSGLSNHLAFGLSVLSWCSSLLVEKNWGGDHPPCPQIPTALKRLDGSVH